MRQVWKYTLRTGDNSIEMPDGAQILVADQQHNEIVLYALVHTGAPRKTRRFYAVETGEDLTALSRSRLHFCGTCFLDDASYVIHVFEHLNEGALCDS